MPILNICSLHLPVICVTKDLKFEGQEGSDFEDVEKSAHALSEQMEAADSAE